MRGLLRYQYWCRFWRLSRRGALARLIKIAVVLSLITCIYEVLWLPSWSKKEAENRGMATMSHEDISTINKLTLTLQSIVEDTRYWLQKAVNKLNIMRSLSPQDTAIAESNITADLDKVSSSVDKSSLIIDTLLYQYLHVPRQDAVWWRQQGMIGRQQGVIGRQQGVIGRQQDAIGRQQRYPYPRPLPQHVLATGCLSHIDAFINVETYLDCNKKLQWMANNWRIDPCYEHQYSVNGTRCSFLIYLSEVESYCPPLPSRRHLINTHFIGRDHEVINERVERPLSGLLPLMSDDPVNYVWIQSRIHSMWSKWVNASHYVINQRLHNSTRSGTRYRKRIWLHLGLLTKQSGFNIAALADKGGPLGELVQWSDLLASLYLLGHHLTLTSQLNTMTAFLKQQTESLKSHCPPPGRGLGGQGGRGGGQKGRGAGAGRFLDLIYTDITGLRQIKKYMKHGFNKYSCMMRILDSFGTEPWFNHQVYATKHKLKSPWAKHHLDPLQFNTMYSHSDDNTFLGFVVESEDSDTDLEGHGERVRRNISLVYGKLLTMWKDHLPYINVISHFTEVHATVVDNVKPRKQNSLTLPPYVHNHGVVSAQEFTDLLHQAKIYVGLGYPYEGPAPLEAIAHGCIFLNPAFDVPKSRLNTKLFADKPTFRS